MKRQSIAFILVFVMAASICAVGLTATTTKADALTITGTSLSVTKNNPVINEPVTFTARLYRVVPGPIPYTTPVTDKVTLTIYHYQYELDTSHVFSFKQVRVNDYSTTTTTGSITWTTSWPSAGMSSGHWWNSDMRIYYADFGGGSGYGASKSSPVTINVRIPTTLTLSGGGGLDEFDAIAYLTNQNGKIVGYRNVVLYSGPSPTSLKPTTPAMIYVTGVPDPYYWIEAAGPQGFPWYYQAKFAGDMVYGPSTSNIVQVTGPSGPPS